MKESKRHHYIPECYLTNFSIDGKGVWVYNIKDKEPYITSIDKIFQKKHWYRIPEELIPENAKDLINPLSIEKEFFADQIESQFHDYLKSIVANIDDILKDTSIFQNCQLHEDYVDEFAMQIAIQYFRTPKARQIIMDTLTDLSEISHMIDSKYLNNPSREGLVSELNEPHNPTIAHFWTVFANNKFIPSITEILKSKIWITFVSPNAPFYTSDTPVIVESLFNTPSNSNISLNERGSTITYPLTKKILFKLFDRAYYKDLENEDRKIFLVNDDFVKKENLMQFSYANNEIISPINNFDVYLK